VGSELARDGSGAGVLRSTSTRLTSRFDQPRRALHQPSNSVIEPGSATLTIADLRILTKSIASPNFRPSGLPGPQGITDENGIEAIKTHAPNAKVEDHI
jgi:hypothetical protein